MALRYVTEAKQFGAALCGCHALCRGLLTSLQAYWTKLILEGLYKLVTGDPTADDVGKDN